MAEQQQSRAKRDSTMTPQDQLVFSNGFALSQMIQACSRADSEDKLVNAVKRLAGFIKAHHAETNEQQKAKIAEMVQKQKAAKRK